MKVSGLGFLGEGVSGLDFTKPGQGFVEARAPIFDRLFRGCSLAGSKLTIVLTV